MCALRLRIGLLLDFLFDEYQLKIWNGVIKATQEMDANLYCFAGGALKSPFINSVQRNFIFDLAGSSHLDGLVIMSAVIGNFSSLQELKDFHDSFHAIPYVGIGADMGTVPSIFIDNSQGIKDLVSHLVLEHKAKRIAFIKGPDDNPEAKARFSAYVDALAAHNLAFDPQLVAPGTFFTGSGEKAVKLFFDQRKIVCDAIIAGNDLTAIDALNALRGRGIRVPQDVALAGFDNVKESRYIRPQLTTVHQPFMDLGYEAVKMLVARLRGDEAPEQKILPTHLRIRESCGCSYKSRYSGLPLPAGKKKQPTAEPWKKCREKAIHKMEQVVRTFYTDAACARQELGWIKDIVENFTRYLSGAGEEAFLNTLENTATSVGQENIDIFNWCQILFILFNALLPCFDRSRDFDRLLRLWNGALEVLLKIELISEAEYIAETNRLFRVICWIGQDLLATFNKQKLKKALRPALAGLGIERFYIVEFHDKNNSRDFCRFIEASEQGKIRTDLIKKKFWETKSVVSLCSRGENKRECLIILPLFVHQEVLGLFIPEHGSLEGFVYENLAVQLSNALKGVNLVDQLSSQAEILATSNKEKEVLLKEIHHRVKNNLQVINSLLNLQCQQIANSETTAHFRAIQNRIRSMSLLHEHLYKSENLTRLNLKYYLEELIDSIKVSYALGTPVDINLHSEDVNIPIEKAIPLGLVINELVSNSFKHAFTLKPGEEPSMITVSCRRYKNNKIFLSVQDNGVGFPKDFNIHNTNSLGMQIVHSVIENQLDGQINLILKEGTRFNMLIPL